MQVQWVRVVALASQLGFDISSLELRLAQSMLDGFSACTVMRNRVLELTCAVQLAGQASYQGLPHNLAAFYAKVPQRANRFVGLSDALNVCCRL